MKHLHGPPAQASRRQRRAQFLADLQLANHVLRHTCSVFLLAAAALILPALSCAPRAGSGVHGVARPQPSADYVGTIEDIVAQDDGWRFVVRVEQVLRAPRGNVLKPGARVSFVTGGILDLMLLIGSSPQLYEPAADVIETGAFLQEEEEEDRLLEVEELLGTPQEGDREALVWLIGERIRIIYHDGFATPYKGRLSVWAWGDEPRPVVQYVGRLKRVTKRADGDLAVELEVTRVLLATPTAPRPGDVIEFVLNHGDNLAGLTMLEAYPGMESDFPDEFVVVYFEEFASPYTGPHITRSW